MSRVIQSGRLSLVPVAPPDEAWLADLLREPLVSRHLGHHEALQARDMIEDSLARSSITASWRLATHSDEHAGLVAIRAPSVATLRQRAIGWRSLEVLILLEPGLWGQGLAAEAVEAVAAYARADGVTFALVGCVEEADTRSRHLMARCGFVELGRAAGRDQPLIVYERAL
jgi:GNAT superfamily N-acetyltransferase